MAVANRHSVLAVIPAYNEADHIGEVVAGALAHLPVLVVDDGSADATSAAAEADGATVLRQNPNQGKGAALRAGFRWAMAAGYQVVVTLDGDGQHDPAEIPTFLQAYGMQAADLVIGMRDFSRMPPLRRIANNLGKLSFSWAMGRPIRDNQSGYRLLSQRMVAAVLDSQERGYEFEVEMIVACILRRYTLAWVPIRTIYTDGGSHIRPWRHFVHFLRMVRLTRQMIRYHEMEFRG